jgi:AcrR family transcriptional regulator
MAQRRDVGKRRRQQVIDAAVAVIAEKGIQHLSLSAIEKKTKMSRGQLTYYFHAKEDILLAVFDHLIDQMQKEHQSGQPPDVSVCGVGWEKMKALLTFFVLHPPAAPEFHALQYTFLSQIVFRDDFRQRLASLYEYWRGLGSADFAHDLPAPPGRPVVSPRTLASFIQALLHGFAIQRVADPSAFDPQEMLTLTLHLLGSYLGKESPAASERQEDTAKKRSRSRKKE